MSSHENPSQIAILYVESDTDLLRPVASRLRSLFSRLYIAENGTEALEIFKKYRPQIIVTDLQLPLLSGLELIRQIRAQEGSQPAIIVITSNSESEVLIDCIELRVDSYILKPFRLIHFVSVLQKISQGLLLEEKIYQNHQYLLALYDNIPFFKMNTSFSILSLNPRLIQLFEQGDEERFIGEEAERLFAPSSFGAFNAAKTQLLSQKEPYWQGTLTLNTTESTVCYASIFPIRRSHGEVYEFICIMRDITLSHKLQKLKETLISQEREREMLSKLNRTKDDFLAMFSHELKTPLNAIINFAPYVHSKISEVEIPEKEKLSKLLLSIERNGRLMLEMVSGMLDAARLRAGKMEFRPALFDLFALIEQITQDKTLGIPESLQIHGNPKTLIYSDELRMRQILTNLYHNALKYGGGTIHIDYNVKDKENFCIIIEDNGKGIEDKEGVFELYTQEGELLRRRLSGSGIGLYLVRLLCDALKLYIFLDDSPKLGGARFTLCKGDEYAKEYPSGG